MKVNFFLRNNVLHEVHEVVAESAKTFTIRGTMGVKTVRKNGKDGTLHNRCPYGYGLIQFGKRGTKWR